MPEFLPEESDQAVFGIPYGRRRRVRGYDYEYPDESGNWGSGVFEVCEVCGKHITSEYDWHTNHAACEAKLNSRPTDPSESSESSHANAWVDAMLVAEGPDWATKILARDEQRRKRMIANWMTVGMPREECIRAMVLAGYSEAYATKVVDETSVELDEQDRYTS
jgi:hypothetical protein